MENMEGLWFAMGRRFHTTLGNVVYGSNTPHVSPPNYPSPGYAFDGYWTTLEDGGTMYIDVEGNGVIPWNIDESTPTLYAHWKPIQYSISFNANEVGVTGDRTSMTCTYDVATNLPPCAFTRTGYGFSVWTNSTGTAFADRAVVSNLTKTANETVTLYAQWTAKTYPVSFNDGSGTASTSITYGASITPPTREGYTFGGYFTQSDGKGTPCYNADGSMESVDEATISGKTLYAHWIANGYTLSFDTDGGTEIDPITLPCGTTITAPADPTKTGYTFAGWNPTLPSKMPVDGLTVTAQWDINQYTITFDTDGGSEIDSITQNYDTSITAPANPTKMGYTFTEWDPAVPTRMPAENKTVTAQWNINQYTLTFDTDGGEYSMTCTYDVPTNLPSCAFERTGYGFAGWTNSVGTLFADGAQVSNLTAAVDGTVAMYACWTATVDAVSAALAEAVDASSLEFETRGSIVNGDEESPTNANWFAMAGCGEEAGTSAAQSGVLPTDTIGGYSYISWLTTTITGKGVLSFSWRCDAKQRIQGEEWSDKKLYGNLRKAFANPGF